ncbi:hypothetical protein T484DRAFT_1957364 [Baffinella frigidus]|nr:hypothetical protein T484DRAFT_1957364 [Cryptophyta sp. CCMP2293]
MSGRAVALKIADAGSPKVDLRRKGPAARTTSVAAPATFPRRLPSIDRHVSSASHFHFINDDFSRTKSLDEPRKFSKLTPSLAGSAATHFPRRPSIVGPPRAVPWRRPSIKDERFNLQPLAFRGVSSEQGEVNAILSFHSPHGGLTRPSSIALQGSSSMVHLSCIRSEPEGRNAAPPCPSVRLRREAIITHDREVFEKRVKAMRLGRSHSPGGMLRVEGGRGRIPDEPCGSVCPTGEEVVVEVKFAPVKVMWVTEGHARSF